MTVLESQPAPEPGPSPGHRGDSDAPPVTFKRVLGIPSLILFGLAYMVPLAAFTTYGVVTELTEGHLPTAYVVTLIAMVFTAYSYGRMVAASPYSGSVYSYTRKSFGPHFGFMAGWTLLLDYIFLPMLCYLLIGIYMEAYFESVPVQLWILGSIVLVTVLNVLGINMVTRANLILIGAQAVFVVVFVALSVRSIMGSGDAVSLAQPFFDSDMSFGLILGGAAILCLSFLGFDAVSTLAEETRDPVRRLPRAIMLVTVIGGLLFILVSYVGHLAFPQWQEFTDVDSAALDVMQHVGGGLVVTFFTATYVAGCFAAAMVSQASVARILFAMGRDEMLPKRVFGQLSARYRTPVFATVIVSLFSLAALFVSLELTATMISFGALAAFSAVNLAVPKHYIVDKGLREPADLVRYGLVPTAGVLLTLWLWTSLSGFTFVVGLTWMAIGLVYLAWLTRLFTKRPPELQLVDARSGVQPADEEVVPG
jgi:putrescine importer